MKIISNIKTWLRSWITGSSFLGEIPSAAGIAVNEKTSMQVTTVYACVRILAETVASLPLPLYKRTDKGKEKAHEHPLYQILHDTPNPEMTSFTFRETLMTHLLLWGNAYCQVIRNGHGQVLELWPLMPECMEVTRENDDILYIYNTAKGDKAFKPEDILHIPGLGYDGMVGYSPIQMAKNAIGLAKATEEYGSKFFANGARPSGVLTSKGVIKDPKKIQKSWEQAYGSNTKTHRIAVLEEDLTYTPIGIPPEHAQFLQTREFQVNEICRLFRVPPHLVGDLSRATFSNIEHQSLSFVVHSIRPWLVRWEQAIHKTLLTREERNRYFTKFTVEGLLRGDFKARMEGYATARQNGWMSANDIRELEDQNRIPEEEGGDMYLVNGNMISIKAAGGQKNEKVEQEES